MLLLQNHFSTKVKILIKSHLTSNSTSSPQLHSESITPPQTFRLVLSHFYIHIKFEMLTACAGTLWSYSVILFALSHNISLWGTHTVAFITPRQTNLGLVRPLNVTGDLFIYLRLFRQGNQRGRACTRRMFSEHKEKKMIERETEADSFPQILQKNALFP